MLQQGQCGLDHAGLQLGIIRRSEWEAVPERNEQGPRRTHFFRDFTKELNRHRGDAVALQLCGDQSDRLIARGSDRYEQSDVGSLLHGNLRRLGCRVADEPSGCGDRSHE